MGGEETKAGHLPDRITNPWRGLHDAARRYCVQRARHWHAVYCPLRNDREPGGRRSTAEARNVFPRYLVLEAIQADVERLTPESLATEPDPREFLCEVGLTATGSSVRLRFDVIEEAAMAEERNLFCEFVRALSQLEEVEPMPYRRVLANGEAARIEAALEQRWPARRYDYPVVRPWLPVPPDDALALREVAFAEPEAKARLREALGAVGVERLFQVGPDRELKYEVELSEFDPVNNGDESWWCDATFAWRIFSSHESLTSIAGRPLMEALATVWPGYAAWLDVPLLDAE